MKYSVVFLVEEEDEAFANFFDVIYRLFEGRHYEFEVVVVANGTENFVKGQLNSVRGGIRGVKLIAFPKKVPQSVCLISALNQCTGGLIVSLGPFQELSFPSYERLIHAMTDEVDVVVPYRRVRKDALLNRVHSRALNRAVRWVLGVNVHDIGCHAKVYRREVLEALELYGNMYRYFPALAVQKGFHVKEIECDQLEKEWKTEFYNLRLYLDRSIEILNLFFSTKFSKKPLRFFNLVGAGFILLGVLALLYVGFERIALDVPIGARPLLIIGMIGLVGGAQLASFGLLGEIISFVHGRSRREYTIEKII